VDRCSLAVIQDDRCDAGKVDQIALNHSQNDTSGNPCIHGIASCFENGEGGM
jgi:hypothetical protein